jgi:hypothetical protein
VTVAAHRHSHHTDRRAAFRQVRARQVRATVAATLAAVALLLIVPHAATWKLPSLLLLAATYGVYTTRNWRCPQCRVALAYGRVPEQFNCPRCGAVLQWSH